jgi:Leucine-rich repeat (LRR) protein
MLVEDLGLKFNHLSSISVSDLQHFTALIELDLSENNITHIEEGSFANSPELVTM